MRHFVHIGSVISLYGYRVGYCAFLCMCVVYLLNVRVKVKESECLYFLWAFVFVLVCVCVIKKRYFLCVCLSYIAVCIYQVLEQAILLCMSGKKHRLI